ncbi:MAG: acyl-homoserine-lactone synthase [Rhizobiaceae bacterium]
MFFALSTGELMERPRLWQAVHELRYRIFVDEMGWEALARPDRLEIDQFDHEEAVHHLVLRDGELAGYQRMLPTTRPHLLTEVLQDLCVGTPPCGPDIYELTRYSVAPAYRDGRRGMSTVGTELIAGFIEWGMGIGVDKVIIEFQPMWVLRALQLHFLATPLGYQRAYGRQQVVATLLQFNGDTLQTVRERRNHFLPVLARNRPAPAGYRLAS